MSLLNHGARSARYGAVLGALLITLLGTTLANPAHAAAASKLWVATSQDQLWSHDTVSPIEPWTSVDHANHVHAMAGGPGPLWPYAIGGLWAIADFKLWYRPALDLKTNWAPEDVEPAPGVVAMAYADGTLFAVTSDGRLLKRLATLGSSPWTFVGPADGVKALAFGNNTLFGVRNNTLVRRVLKDGTWEPIGEATAVYTMTFANGKLFGVTTDSTVWSRGTGENIHWTPVGHAFFVTAIAGA
jgi:hypothetical protein